MSHRVYTLRKKDSVGFYLFTFKEPFIPKTVLYRKLLNILSCFTGYLKKILVIKHVYELFNS